MAKKTIESVKETDEARKAREAMEAYGSMIEAISDDVDKVRQTPDVFIGQLGSAAVKAMVREIIQNSFDIIRKAMLPGSPITIQDPEVTLIVDERTWEFTVIDHGSGIPFGKLEVIFSQTHSGSSYHKMDGDFGAGKNGCGAAVTNFLSEYFIVESYVNGLGGHIVEYDHGHIKTHEREIPKKDCKIPQGTITRWKPDPSAIGVFNDIDWKTIYDLFSKIICLTELGTKLCFKAIDIAGKSYEYHITNAKGAYQLLDMLTMRPLITPILISDRTTTVNPIKRQLDGSPWNDTLGINALITYDGSMDPMKMMAFANTSPSILGEGSNKSTHMAGATAGICKFFKDYMNTIYLANSKGNLVITDADVQAGLCVVIDAGHTSASYNAQNKEILDNKDMTPFAKAAMLKGLEAWSKSNPADLNKICKYLKDVGQARMSAEKEKAKVVKNYETTALSGGFPAKYVKPNGRDHLELFIVEGDSAKGTVKTARDSSCQAIFPVRGKSLNNALNYNRATMMANAEVQAIIKILGIEPANPGKHIPQGPVEKCRFEKIIFLADADFDGYHINTLLLLFFLIYYPDLIKAGRVYRCVPPLYGAKVGNSYRYFADEQSFIEYTLSIFAKTYKVCDINGKPISTKDLVGLLTRTRHFADKFDSIAKNVALTPDLLEVILQNRLNPIGKFKKAIKAFDRFLDADLLNGKPHITGAHNMIQNDTLVDEFFCRLTEPVMATIDNEPHMFMVNGQHMSLYGLCSAFRTFTPDVQRYKGLGENDPDDLARTAVLPGSDRCLIQYTMENAAEQIERIRSINANKLKFLQNLPEECKGDFE